jgi:anti-sigma factor RsiW
MKCSEALELISLTIDGEADSKQERMLRFHINGCASCRRALEMSRTISMAVASLPDPQPSADLENLVRARLEFQDYDTSPLENPRRFLLLRRAAVVLPFAATLVIAARVFIPSVSPDTAAASEAVEVQYIPLPASAYTRPVTLTTF